MFAWFVRFLGFGVGRFVLCYFWVLGVRCFRWVLGFDCVCWLIVGLVLLDRCCTCGF